MEPTGTPSESAALEIMAPHALELITSAEINQQVATAKKFPRPELARIKKRMLDFATLDEETAESCFYTLRRQDRDGDAKVIQGPSVRLAEIAVACYGNLRAASRIIDNDGRAITSQGICLDLETNVCISVEVRRRITNRNGKTYSDDMQIVTGNAANSIAFRNAVLKVIPGALVNPVYEAAKLVAVGDATTLSVKRDKVIKRFASMGVEQARVLAAVGRETVEAVGLEDLENLIGIGTAIKGGDTSIDEAFPPIQKPGAAKTGTEALKDKLKEQQDQRRAESAPAVAPPASPEPPAASAEQPPASQTKPEAQGTPSKPKLEPAPPAVSATDDIVRCQVNVVASAMDAHLSECPSVKRGETPQDDLFADKKPANPAVERSLKTYGEAAGFAPLPDVFDVKAGLEVYFIDGGKKKRLQAEEDTWKLVSSEDYTTAPAPAPAAPSPQAVPDPPATRQRRRNADAFNGGKA